MKSAILRFISLLLFTLGMSWAMISLTRPEPPRLADSPQEHRFSYRLPLGLPVHYTIFW